ncbi:MAG TPA: asparagine synthase (glutamine-hydrolyzing) [Solirubrobacterales bacterium]|jgi:asparagine synthase (glutamine-hydrolysing)|nr:asparagine synthase (glutamine-hydrolyzing) [Solirubrobacterales bacterium]
MCGIAGQARAGGGAVERDVIARMCAAQEHRGPDSSGIHLSPGIGLGIRRLRVIDLETGDQPVYNEDRSVAVVLNGEIYNYEELRQQLLRRGHRLSGKGDTEVIAHLYEEHGIECVSRLQGMFCFALWDSRHRLLLLARDRVGKKPLFYSFRGGVLSFASELRALIEDPEVPRQLDCEAIDAYLAYGYVPGPMSIYRGVRKLPPAHRLVYQEGAIASERYWRLDYSVKRPVNDLRELHEEIRACLRASVARRMVADVPLGAFLSGGIDSSAVVAAMAEQSSQPVKTFSIGFADEAVNELPRARLVADRFATDHHELIVEPDAVELLPKLARHYGEPFGDHSALPCFYLAEMARRHVTVALNGDGGDESFGGYQRYTSNLLAARLERLPAPLRRAIAATAGRVGGGVGTESRPRRALRFAGRLAGRPQERYLRQVSIFDAEERQALYTPELARMTAAAATDDVLLRPWREAGGAGLLDQLLEVDTTVYLPGDLLAKIDIATMAFSLEARSPLLDPEMMEMAASIPAVHKARGLQRKIALRGALRGWLPDAILDGPKRGFELPVARWLRTDLAPFTREVLLDRESTNRGWTRPGAVAALIDQHVAGTADHGRKLWSLLVLELWASSVSPANS